MDKTDKALWNWLHNKTRSDYDFADRIRWLRDECENDEEPLNDISLFSLLTFFEYRPSLTANSSGEISATWHFPDKQLILRFKGDASIDALLISR